MKTNATHTFWYLTLILAVLFLLIAVKPRTPNKPHGLFLPSAPQKFKSNKSSKLFAEMPPDYIKTGTLSVMLHTGSEKPTAKEEKSIILYALKKAAHHGGDGLIINQMYYESPQDVGNPLSAYRLIGSVITAKDHP